MRFLKSTCAAAPPRQRLSRTGALARGAMKLVLLGIQLELAELLKREQA